MNNTHQTLNTEPGLYPQDDNTYLVILSQPLNIGDENQHAVRITRALTAAEEDKAGGMAVLTMMQNKPYAKVIANVTSPMITANMFMQMPSKDRLSLMQGILDFFE